MKKKFDGRKNKLGNKTTGEGRQAYKDESAPFEDWPRNEFSLLQNASKGKGLLRPL